MEPLSPHLGTETGWPLAAQPGGHLALDVQPLDLREEIPLVDEPPSQLCSASAAPAAATPTLSLPSFLGEPSEPLEQRMRWFVQRFQCQWVGFSAHPLLLTAAALGAPPPPRHPVHPESPCGATSPSARTRFPLETQRERRPQHPEGTW